MTGSASGPALVVRGLTTSDRDLVGVDLEVSSGDRLSLIGDTAAERTKLLEAMAGLGKIAAGEILLDGRAIESKGVAARARTGLVMVAATGGLFSGISVRGHLRLVRSAKSTEWIYDVFPELASRRDQRVGTLSGGEKRMVALARAFVCVPKVLLLDEPARGLAPAVVSRLVDVLSGPRLAASAIVLSEESPVVTNALANRFVVLEDGRLAGGGPRSDLERALAEHGGNRAMFSASP